MQHKQKTVSLVMPGYNEGENVIRMYSSIIGFLEKSGLEDHYSFEILFVNDGSKDNTWDYIESLCKKDTRVVGINLSKNYGKEIALSAGVEKASGDAIITLDCDGQHPIEKIEEFIMYRRQGYHIVYQKRSKNRGTSRFRQLLSSIYYMIFNSLSDNRIDPNCTDFRLIDKSVQKELIKFKEHNRMFRGLVDSMGFNKIGIEFDALERMDAAPPRYTFSKLLQLFKNSIIGFSTKPLSLVLYLGILLGIFAMISAAAIVYDKRLSGVTNTNLILIVIISLIGCSILLGLWIIGLYIGNIYEEVKGRPLYMTKEVLNA